MRKTLAFFVFLFLLSSLFAKDYVIHDYDFHIIGRTQEQALRRAIGNDEGTSFESVEEMESVLEDKRQMLLDRRIFQDVRCWWTEMEADEENIYVTIHFEILGALSAYASPGGTYDSNYGLRFIFSGVDQNFLGSMHESSILLDYRQQDCTFDNTLFLLCAKTGGFFLGMDTTIHFDLFLYNKETEKNRLTLEISSKGNSLENNFGLMTNLNGKPEIEDFRNHIYEELVFHATESISLGIGVDTSIPFSETMEIEASAEASYSFLDLTGLNLTATVETSHIWKDNSYFESVNSIVLMTSERNIDWNKDFREGYDYKIKAEASDNRQWEIEADIKGYLQMTSWMNLHARVFLRTSNYQDKDINSKFTKTIRGVRDNNPVLKDWDFNNAIVLNTSLFCYLFSINWLGSFYLNPFLDIASISKANGEFMGGAGCEFFAILNQWPGLPFRFSYGHSLTDPKEWEFTINAQFFY